MAQRMRPGTRVIGVDNHSYALERGKGLARLWLDRQDEICGGADSNDRTGVAGQSDQGGGVSLGRFGAERSRQGDSPFTSSGGRKCEWMCVDLRKTGSLHGIRASAIHGHRFKCEQLLPILRDEVRQCDSVFAVKDGRSVRGSCKCQYWERVYYGCVMWNPKRKELILLRAECWEL